MKVDPTKAAGLRCDCKRQRCETNLDDRGKLTGEVSDQVLRNGEDHGFLVPEAAQPGTLGTKLETNARTMANGRNWGIWSVAAQARYEFRFRPVDSSLPPRSLDRAAQLLDPDRINGLQ